MNASIPVILRALAGAVSIPGLFGDKAAKLSPILNTLGALAEVPAALEPERAALLAQIQRWTDENRAPTDEELDAFKAQRDDLDQKLREARSSLGSTVKGLAVLALAIAAAFFMPSTVRAETLKFTVAQTVNANGSVTPRLTWCTEVALTDGPTCSGAGPAVACTATGDWSGAKGPAGSETLAAVTTGKSYTLQCSWAGQDQFTLNWIPPTKNDDGSTLTDLAGYHIYYGTSSTMSNNQVKDIPNPAATSVVLGPGLAPGTWYVVIDAYNAAKVPSVKVPSPPLSKVLGSGMSVTQSVKVTFPNPPTGLTAQ